jgi:hypothetical protein
MIGPLRHPERSKERVPAPLSSSLAAADPLPGAALEREQAKERETERRRVIAQAVHHRGASGENAISSERLNSIVRRD